MVYFEQEVAVFPLCHNLYNPFTVGYHEITPNHLDAYPSCALLQNFLVILVKGVFNGLHWIL